MSLLLVCGAGCGINAVGLGLAATRHWNTVTSATVETTIVRTGGKSWAIAAEAGGFASMSKTLSATRTVVYYRGYFRVSTATPPATVQVFAADLAAGTDFQLWITTGGVLRCGGTWTTSVDGPTLTTGVWYGVELEIDVTASPNVCRWRTWDGSAWTSQSNASKVQAATTIATVWIACWGPTSGMTVYHADVLIGEGTTAGEHYDPAVSKGGQVKIYRPNADGTHSFTAADFGYNAAGGDVATSATDVYTYLDESDQKDVTDFIRQKVIRTTGYVEVAFADEATLDPPRAVAVTSTHHASSTGANQQTVKITDDAGTSLTTVWSNDDVSDTTAHYRHKVVETKPSGGAWTTSALNATVARLGYSGDVTDIPYWDSISLEVEFTDQPPSAATADPMGLMGFFGL